jgi:DNA-binding transcriptional MocR family regulator
MEDRTTSGKVARKASVAAVVEILGDWAVGRGPLFRQLSRGLGSGIERGALAAGARLPSERDLAAALHISRGTALRAYELLAAEGHLERTRGSGTFVPAAATLSLPVGREGSALVHRLVDRSDGDHKMIDLSISVLHDARGLPEITVSTSDLVGVRPDTGLSPWGLPALRRAIAGHLSSSGLVSHDRQIVVTTGAQQAISAAIACWVRPGDAVVVDDPTYPGVLSALMAAGARPIGLPVDADGIRPEDLREALRRRPTLIYLQSAAHSPTGSLLSASRRYGLAELIDESRVPVIEDMALAELTWQPCPPPLSSLCPDASIVAIGSLDKLFWGGLRVGWARATEPVALRLARVKATHDLGSSVVSQLMAERLLTLLPETDFGPRRRAEMKARYHTLAGALRRELPEWSWSEPRGGLSIWARLPVHDAGTFAQVALRHGVAVASADALSVGTANRQYLRLSFSGPPLELTTGVRRLAGAWRSWRG